MSSVCRIIGALIVTLLLPYLQAAPMAQAAPTAQTAPTAQAAPMVQATPTVQAAPMVQATPAVPASSEPHADLSSVSLSLPEAVERSRQQHPRVAAALADHFQKPRIGAAGQASQKAPTPWHTIGNWEIGKGA